METPICLELLIATICAWAGLCGCLDELARDIKSAKICFFLYLLVVV